MSLREVCQTKNTHEEDLVRDGNILNQVIIRPEGGQLSPRTQKVDFVLSFVCQLRFFNHKILHSAFPYYTRESAAAAGEVDAPQRSPVAIRKHTHVHNAAEW